MHTCITCKGTTDTSLAIVITPFPLATEDLLLLEANVRRSKVSSSRWNRLRCAMIVSLDVEDGKTILVRATEHKGSTAEEECSVVGVGVVWFQVC
jgi:hypothetical protein